MGEERLMEAGRIVAVWIDRRGTGMTADAPAGTQILQVDFPIDFDEDGGQLLHVETGDVYDYASADPDGDTITLSAPLPTGVSFAAGDALRVYPLADDLMANVRVDDAEADEEPIVARIPHTVRAMLPEGIRDRLALEGEAVLVEEAGEEFVVADVVGSQPDVDGTYLVVNSVTADKLEAVMTLTNTLLAGSETGGRVEVGFGTGDMSSMIGINARAPDGQTITFMLNAVTGEVFLKGRTQFGTGSVLESDHIDLVEQPVGVVEPELRQKRQAALPDAATSISASWVSDTLPTSTLLAYVAAEHPTSDAPAPVFTPPPGWVLINSSTNVQIRVSLYYIPDAASRTGDETFTFDVSAYATMGLFEYEGLDVTPLDQTAAASGTGSTMSSGTTATTTQADELWFAVAGEHVGLPWDPPTNGFTDLGYVESANQTASVAASRPATAVGAASTSWTQPFGLEPRWAGVIATFKARTSTGDPAVTALDTVRMYAKERNGETELHTVNSGGIVRVLGSDYVRLAETELAAVAAAVQFTDIDQNYRDLLLTFRGIKANDPNAFRDLVLRFNGDTGTNYFYTRRRHIGDGTDSSSTANFTGISTLAIGTWMSQGEVRVSEYADPADVKTCHGISFAMSGTASTDLVSQIGGGRWSSTSPITSVTLLPFAGDFAAGTTFQLWGIGKLT